MAIAYDVDTATASNGPEGQDREMVLSGRLTINEAEIVCDDLLRCLAGCRQLILVTDRLDVVDVAGLQLLISARRSAERAGKAVRLAAGPDGALLSALMAAGFRSAADDGRRDLSRDPFWLGSEAACSG